MLILLAIIRYGKPMDEKEKSLFLKMIVNSHIKDEEVEEEAELRLAFEKRLKAYGEIADIQLSGILKTVLTYSDINEFA